MNRNQIGGTVCYLAGKVQEEAGKLVVNKEQQAKGIYIHNQISGNAEKLLGDAKEIGQDALNTVDYL